MDDATEHGEETGRSSELERTICQGSPDMNFSAFDVKFDETKNETMARRPPTKTQQLNKY